MRSLLSRPKNIQARILFHHLSKRERRKGRNSAACLRDGGNEANNRSVTCPGTFSWLWKSSQGWDYPDQPPPLQKSPSPTSLTDGDLA